MSARVLPGEVASTFKAENQPSSALPERSHPPLILMGLDWGGLRTGRFRGATPRKLSFIGSTIFGGNAPSFRPFR
jgi:hypothetical protein